MGSSRYFDLFFACVNAVAAKVFSVLVEFGLLSTLLASVATALDVCSLVGFLIAIVTVFLPDHGVRVFADQINQFRGTLHIHFVVKPPLVSRLWVA